MVIKPYNGYISPSTGSPLLSFRLATIKAGTCPRRVRTRQTGMSLWSWRSAFRPPRSAICWFGSVWDVWGSQNENLIFGVTSITGKPLAVTRWRIISSVSLYLWCLEIPFGIGESATPWPSQSSRSHTLQWVPGTRTWKLARGDFSTGFCNLEIPRPSTHKTSRWWKNNEVFCVNQYVMKWLFLAPSK